MLTFFFAYSTYEADFARRHYDSPLFSARLLTLPPTRGGNAHCARKFFPSFCLTNGRTSSSPTFLMEEEEYHYYLIVKIIFFCFILIFCVSLRNILLISDCQSSNSIVHFIKKKICKSKRIVRSNNFNKTHNLSRIWNSVTCFSAYLHIGLEDPVRYD